MPGVGTHVPIPAFRGHAARLGWDTTSGHWYTGRGQVVVNTASTGPAGLTAGQAIHLAVGGVTVTATVTGTVYDPGVGSLRTSWATLHGAAGLAVNQYIVALQPGITPAAYAAALGKTLGLIRLLTVLVAVLAGLGVLNATLMLARERVHDLGI